MDSVPTMKVKSKDGSEVIVNASDFNSELHTKIEPVKVERTKVEEKKVERTKVVETPPQTPHR